MNLKPCPFCGDSAHLEQNYSYKARSFFVYVKCDLCGAQSRIYNDTTEAAAAGWNTQACELAEKAWNRRRPDCSTDTE